MTKPRLRHSVDQPDDAPNAGQDHPDRRCFERRICKPNLSNNTSAKFHFDSQTRVASRVPPSDGNPGTTRVARERKIGLFRHAIRFPDPLEAITTARASPVINNDGAAFAISQLSVPPKAFPC